MIKKKKKIFVFSVIGMVAVLLLWFLGFVSPIFNIHEVVVEGSAYNFTIGMSKNEALIIVQDKYPNVLDIAHTLPNGNITFESLDLESSHEEILLTSDEWRLMYKEEPKWFVIEFENNVVVEINYFHQRNELP